MNLTGLKANDYISVSLGGRVVAVPNGGEILVETEGGKVLRFDVSMNPGIVKVTPPIKWQIGDIVRYLGEPGLYVVVAVKDDGSLKISELGDVWPHMLKRVCRVENREDGL